jgi:hypothetical protein
MIAHARARAVTMVRGSVLLIWSATLRSVTLGRVATPACGGRRDFTPDPDSLTHPELGLE